MAKNFEVVDSLKYLNAIVTDVGSEQEVLSRTVQASAALTRLRIIWRDQKILLNPKSDWCTNLQHQFSHMPVRHDS